MITATDAAINHIGRALDKRGHGFGIRIGVTTSGCSGMAYTMEYLDADTDILSHDEIFKFDDVVIVVDKKSLTYIEGSEIDFTKEGLNEGFKFRNPLQTGECGCGESFYV